MRRVSVAARAHSAEPSRGTVKARQACLSGFPSAPPQKQQGALFGESTSRPQRGGGGAWVAGTAAVLIVSGLPCVSLTLGSLCRRLAVLSLQEAHVSWVVHRGAQGGPSMPKRRLQCGTCGTVIKVSSRIYRPVDMCASSLMLCAVMCRTGPHCAAHDFRPGASPRIAAALSSSSAEPAPPVIASNAANTSAARAPKRPCRDSAAADALLESTGSPHMLACARQRLPISNPPAGDGSVITISSTAVCGGAPRRSAGHVCRGKRVEVVAGGRGGSPQERAGAASGAASRVTLAACRQVCPRCATAHTFIKCGRSECGTLMCLPENVNQFSCPRLHCMQDAGARLRWRSCSCRTSIICRLPCRTLCRVPRGSCPRREAVF